MPAEQERSPVDLSFDLPGRTAVITGGASGIGRSIAATFAAKGARTALLDRDGAAARATAADIGCDLAVDCDVTDIDSIQRATASVISNFGHVDILVNSAGVVQLAPAEVLPVQAWDLTLAVNLRGTFLMCQSIGSHMLTRGCGRIINMASQAATVALDEHVAYCASKAGVLGLTRVLASEWAGRGVTVNAISPTVVLTDLGRKAWAGARGDRFAQQIPTGRFAFPDEVAALALYLASDAAAMVNGADLLMDGGYTIR